LTRPANPTRENRVWVLYNRVRVNLKKKKKKKKKRNDSDPVNPKRKLRKAVHFICDSLILFFELTNHNLTNYDSHMRGREPERDTERGTERKRERDETRRGTVKVTPRPTFRRLISFTSLRQKLQSHHPFLQPILLFYHFFTFLLSYPFLSLIPTGEDRDCRRRGNQDPIFRWINAGEA
jgi:hypothetical protein